MRFYIFFFINYVALNLGILEMYAIWKNNPFLEHFEIIKMNNFYVKLMRWSDVLEVDVLTNHSI